MEYILRMPLGHSPSPEALSRVIQDYQNPESYAELCAYIDQILSAASAEFRRKPVREPGDDNPFLPLEQLLGLIIYEWPSIDDDDAYSEYLVALYQLIYEEAGKYYYPVTDVQTELPDDLMPAAHFDLQTHEDTVYRQYQQAILGLIAARASG